MCRLYQTSVHSQAPKLTEEKYPEDEDYDEEAENWADEDKEMEEFDEEEERKMMEKKLKRKEKKLKEEEKNQQKLPHWLQKVHQTLLSPFFFTFLSLSLLTTFQLQQSELIRRVYRPTRLLKNLVSSAPTWKRR